MADITQNPDYRLVMTFLQNIRPGDMDQESSEQLMMIGQRIQAGGALTDREREMFTSVVGAMPQMPMDPGSAVRDGEMPMDPGSAVRRGEMPMAQMPMDPGSAVRRGEMPMDPGSAVRRGEMPMAQMPMDPGSAVRDGEMMGTYQVDDGEMQMTPSQMRAMQESGAITPDAGRVMSLQEAIDAGFVTPTRPQARPMMTSPRPQMRR